MILGVLMVLLGEATAFSSIKILEWAGVFFLINTAYFIVSEEPKLEKRFGADYLEYKKHVGRWIPRLTPYHRLGTELLKDRLTKESHPSPFGEPARTTGSAGGPGVRS